MEMPIVLTGVYLNESTFMHVSVMFIFIIRAYHLYFSSSESYEGMSQHLIICFLSVLQFKYLRFYMDSKRHFRMRLPEVYL